MRFAAKSEKGKRIQNEDYVYIPAGRDDIPLAVVADGMGGHRAGSIASTLAVETLLEEFRGSGERWPESRIVPAVRRANEAVYEMSRERPDCRGMGTTMVLALVNAERYVAANIGDSRLYHFDGESLHQITEDHSYVAELVAAGQITQEEALSHPRRNIITRALGTRSREKADIFHGMWAAGQMLMLCSDGLHGVLAERDMARILREEADMQAACEELVQIAIYAGSTDNISVALIRNEEET